MNESKENNNSLNIKVADELFELEVRNKVEDPSVYNDPYGRIIFDELDFEEDIENHDYYELLKLYEFEWLDSWLMELGFNFDNPDDLAFYSNNINKIILKAMHLGLLRDIFSSITITPFWGTGGSPGTHTDIFNKAMNILNNDRYSTIYNYIDYWGINLKNYVNDPDKLASENTGGTHYYIATGTPTAYGAYYKNRNGNYSRSARTKLEDHYFMAVSSYKNGNVQASMKALGYAIHFLSDAICPPHAAGVSDGDYILKKPHGKYEDYVDSNISLYTATTAVGYYNMYLDVKGWGTSSDTVIQQFSFSGDTNQQFRAKYENDGYFRFEPVNASGKTMSFTDGGDSIIKSITNSTYQRFKPTYMGNGCYRIMTGHTDGDFIEHKSVQRNVLTLDSISEGSPLSIRGKSTSSYQKFRAEALPSGNIVLYTEASYYADALCFNSSYPSPVLFFSRSILPTRLCESPLFCSSLYWVMPFSASNSPIRIATALLTFLSISTSLSVIKYSVTQQ